MYSRCLCTHLAARYIGANLSRSGFGALNEIYILRLWSFETGLIFLLEIYAYEACVFGLLFGAIPKGGKLPFYSSSNFS